MKKRLFLIRHGESYKNVRDEHGGKGDSLTQKGIKQVREIANFLLNNEKIIVEKTIIFWHQSPQVKETVEILCKTCKCQSKCDKSIRGYYFGVISGLSGRDIKRLYPDIYSRLQQWREGRLNPLQLGIPKSEDNYEFYKRIYSFINKNIFNNTTFTDIIVVGTTSLLIMMTNILLLGDCFSFENYNCIHFDLGSITKFLIYENINNTQLEYINRRCWL